MADIAPQHVAICPAAPEGERILVLTPTNTTKANTWRKPSPEDLRQIARDVPEAAGVAVGDWAEARAALGRERASYETALAACEREREALASKTAALEALRKSLADAAGKLDTALAAL